MIIAIPQLNYKAGDIQGNSAYLPFAILHTQRYGLFRFPGKHRLSNFTTQPMKHHEATLTKNKRFNHKKYEHFSYTH